MSNRRASYYYAGGKRVSLDPDPDHLALDLRRAAPLRLEAALEFLKPQMDVLPGGTVVVPRALMPGPILADLERVGAIEPVYRAGRVRIVALPEVRVRIEPDRLKALVSAVKQTGIPAEVVSEGPGQVVMRPRSNLGADAVSLANFVHEHVHPLGVEARFIRIVPRPGRAANSTSPRAITT